MSYKTLFIRISFLVLVTSLIFLGTFSLQPAKEKATSSKTLNIFCWGAYFPEEVISRFEKESGVRVRTSFFTTNEELLSKLRQTKGKGYDLFICSDYAMKTLIDDHLIKPYDPVRAPYKNRISPYLLHQFHDQENIYSLPLSWEVYGLIVPKDKAPASPSLETIFQNDPDSGQVVMTPDPIEAVTFAAYYLFNKTTDLTPSQLGEIRGLLRKQKTWVESYTDYRTKHLVAGENCRAGLLKTFFLSQLAQESPHIAFLLPKEGIFTSIESFGLSKEIEHEEEAYRFLEFIYRPEIMALQTEQYSLFPACPDALPYAKGLSPLFFEILQEIEDRQDFRFFNYTIPPDTILEMWVHAKT